MKKSVILGYYVALLCGLAVQAFAQVDSLVGPEPSPLPEVPWYTYLLTISGPALPLLGKLLLMIPFVPNKLIPAINLVVNYVVKYMAILGWDQVEPMVEASTSPEESGIKLAGFFANFGLQVGALAWSAVETFAASKFYEWRRDVARKSGTTAWLEKGKRSIY